MTAPHPRFRYPKRTRIVVVVVLAVAVAGFTLGFMAYEPGGDDEAVEVSGGRGGGGGGEGRALDPEIRVTPLRDAETVPVQETIVLQLEPGWVAELELRRPDGASVPLPSDEIDVTPLNQFIYDPGEGKAIELLPEGRNCVRYTAWSRVEGREASELTDEWCFSVL